MIDEDRLEQELICQLTGEELYDIVDLEAGSEEEDESVYVSQESRNGSGLDGIPRVVSRSGRVSLSWRGASSRNDECPESESDDGGDEDCEDEDYIEKYRNNLNLLILVLTVFSIYNFYLFMKGN